MSELRFVAVDGYCLEPCGKQEFSVQDVSVSKRALVEAEVNGDGSTSFFEANVRAVQKKQNTTMESYSQLLFEESQFSSSDYGLQWKKPMCTCTSGQILGRLFPLSLALQISR